MDNYEIIAFHVDLSEISEGESVRLPGGWQPLGIAEKNGNDLALILYRVALPIA
jgi:hypothetical protein